MIEPSPTELPTEELTSILDSSSKIYFPSGDNPNFPCLPPYDLPTEEPTSLLVSEPYFYSPSDNPSSLPYLIPFGIPWWSLSQIHHIHLFALTLDISPHFHQNKHKSNPLTLSPQNKSPQNYHHFFLCLLFLLPVLVPLPSQLLIPVPFQVLVPQFQDPISYHPLFQTRYFPFNLSAKSIPQSRVIHATRQSGLISQKLPITQLVTNPGQKCQLATVCSPLN